MTHWTCRLCYSGEEPIEWKRPKLRSEDYVTSSIWYCSRCGKVYAHLRVQHFFDNRLMEFIAWSGCCPDCEPPRLAATPGSVWNFWDHEFLNSLPVEVLSWEFELHYEHARKKGSLS